MEISEDEIEDLFVSIAFHPPRTNYELRAYYELYKSLDTAYTLPQIFSLMGVSSKKIQTFTVKMGRNWSIKELEQSVSYLKNYNTEIRAILYTFSKSARNKTSL
jgi:hypothetical protein